MLLIAQVQKAKWFENDGFCSFTNNKHSGQNRKIPPALGTNQIAGFGGFRPLASLEKIKYVLAHVNEIPSRKRVLSGAPCTTCNWVRRQVTVNRPQSNSKSCQRFIQVSLPAMRNFSWLVTRYPPIFYCVTGQNNVFKGSLKSVASPRKKPLNTSGRYSLDFNKDKSMRQV